jgi:hypothetical protein
MSKLTVETVTDLLNDMGADYREHDGYVGRGREAASTIAIITDEKPWGTVGLKLKALGLSYDSLGREFIFYN